MKHPNLSSSLLLSFQPEILRASQESKSWRVAGDTEGRGRLVKMREKKKTQESKETDITNWNQNSLDSENRSHTVPRMQRYGVSG